MNWKFWKTKPKYEVEIKEVSVPTLARWYVYDTEVSSPNSISAAFGMIPVSEEGELTEILASEQRQARVDPYLSFIKVMSSINASALVALNRDVAKTMDIPSEDLEVLEDAIHNMYGSISFAAVYSAFSAALELGILSNPGTVSTGELPND